MFDWIRKQINKIREKKEDKRLKKEAKRLEKLAKEQPEVQVDERDYLNEWNRDHPEEFLDFRLRTIEDEMADIAAQMGLDANTEDDVNPLEEHGTAVEVGPAVGTAGVEPTLADSSDDKECDQPVPLFEADFSAFKVADADVILDNGKASGKETIIGNPLSSNTPEDRLAAGDKGAEQVPGLEVDIRDFDVKLTPVPVNDTNVEMTRSTSLPILSGTPADDRIQAIRDNRRYKTQRWEMIADASFLMALDRVRGAKKNN